MNIIDIRNGRPNAFDCVKFDDSYDVLYRIGGYIYISDEHREPNGDKRVLCRVEDIEDFIKAVKVARDLPERK